jgi:hypothetical protein
MARQQTRLSARAVSALSKPGRHADGGNLYLVVDKSGAKRWVFLFRWDGRLREMGLGGLNSVPLARARELATKARENAASGINPLELRRIERRVPTFGEAADDLISSLVSGWRNEPVPVAHDAQSCRRRTDRRRACRAQRERRYLPVGRAGRASIDRINIRELMDRIAREGRHICDKPEGRPNDTLA